MAKEDFCFTYYDGDAARDTTHMNRLERGAYHDIVISQRKFGRLSIEQIKRVLSKDFDVCWPALELILKQDQNGKYYVEWLDNSITKMRKQSAKQKDNVTKRYQQDTNQIPDNYQTTELVEPKNSLVIPLENENGNGSKGIRGAGGKGEVTTIGNGSKYVLIMPAGIGEPKLKICGVEGLRECFDSHGSILRDEQQYAKKFLYTNNGKPYNDFRHLYNDYKQFCEKQFG